jgi:hypothetical protein
MFGNIALQKHPEFSQLGVFILGFDDRESVLIEMTIIAIE